MAAPIKFAKGGGNSCAVISCTNNRKHLYECQNAACDAHGTKHSECPCLTPYSLHRMPKGDRKLEWAAALQRKNLPKTVSVCSKHFVDGRPTERNDVPTLYLGYNTDVKAGRRVLKRKFQPTECAESNCQPDSDTDAEECSNINDSSTSWMETGVQTGDQGVSVATQWHDSSTQDHLYVHTATGNTCNMSTQTPNPSFVSKGVNCTTSHITMSSEKIVSDKVCQLYTGLFLEVYLTLVQVMTTISTPFKFTRSVADQLLLVLMRLRLNLLFADLANRFGISESQASKIFSSWIPLLSNKLKQLIVWLPRETIRATMPSSFEEKYPKTTIIIDCAETFMQRPNNLKTRGETYSQYKSHNTVKYLIGVAPHGQIMFISKSFGGRASDKFIVENSGFLKYLLPGDEVMADRGFTIRDLLFPLRVKLNMPAFTKGKPQLSEEEVTETRRIAHVRIHVERAIRRLKVFKILSNVVPVTSVKKLDDILIVCSALVNLGQVLIKDVEDETEDSLSED